MKIGRRLVLIFAVTLAILSGGVFAAYRYIRQRLIQMEASYQLEMQRLNIEYEIRMRKNLEALQQAEPGSQAEEELTDSILKDLGYSAVAGNSREVSRSRDAEQSPERKAIALKWAKVAADEAAFKSKFHALCRIHLEQNLSSQITEAELPNFAMPEGWTSEDQRDPGRRVLGQPPIDVAKRPGD